MKLLWENISTNEEIQLNISDSILIEPFQKFSFQYLISLTTEEINIINKVGPMIYIKVIFNYKHMKAVYNVFLLLKI